MSLFSPQPEHSDSPLSQPEQQANSQQSSLAESGESVSVGTLLLPIFFAGMEACWVAAILLAMGSLHIFGSQGSFMPLWTPFLLLAGSQWLSTRLGYQSEQDSEGSTNGGRGSTGTPLLIGFICVTVLLSIWQSIYMQSYLMVDPRWLLSMLNDILLLNPPIYHSVGIIIISLYLCWRGLRLSSQPLEPSHVFNGLRIGMGILVLLILVRAGQVSAGMATGTDGITLLLLIPAFLFFALAAHTLARIQFVRHAHPIEQEESNEAQERAVLTTIGLVGVALLLLTILSANFVSPVSTQALFAALGTLYTNAVIVLANILVILATPLFWLYTLYQQLFPQRNPSNKNNQPQGPGHTIPHVQVKTLELPLLLSILQVAIPIILLTIVAFLLWWALRHRKARVIRMRRIIEVHETLWSWQLFLTQLKAFWLAIWHRFFPPKSTEEQAEEKWEQLTGDPAVRTIREMYRALLKRAALRGYPRMKNETPAEFRDRLNTRTPLAQPALTRLTEAYNATRYGNVIFHEPDINIVQTEWNRLDQQWKQ